MAQEAPRGRELKRRHVALSVATADKPVELHVAPDYLTTLEFDSPVVRDSVSLDDSGGRFALFEATNRTVVLRPAMEVASGQSVTLTVPFADDLAPPRAVFSLVTHGSEVDGQVMVSRLPRTAEAVQAELDEVRAACAAKEAELEGLRRRSAASGPVGMIFAGLLDETGVQAGRLEMARGKPTGSLMPEEVFVFRATGWAALALRVHNTGSEPWTPAEAQLATVASGERINVLAVHMRELLIEPGGRALVVVETGTPRWPVGAFLRLELRDSAGARRLLIPRFAF
ncbi:DUF2381 family protein [Pyxidicoccus xibeiensis]|uniref:DUF2381 family protein n=1 Tax=Pyxidicoccus xibeiensis TaxID=2906759 RepID=UPI0020A7B579|nr:DUF2381 family protein [Pyxidicoccus xibeiensis]MCP3144537.1 DUF2381 family protein [Pyxidicoccus xibeiensis]